MENGVFCHWGNVSDMCSDVFAVCLVTDSIACRSISDHRDTLDILARLVTT